ncbi:hypothetical protein HDU90_003555 [Geranomyces variabilis]|nr:hypothetical protein HDU90_003555 [Geranomyces variabilis]
MTTLRGDQVRQYEAPAPPKAQGVPVEHDPLTKSSQGIERDPEVAKFAELDRSAPAGDTAKKQESQHEAGEDHKLQPTSNVDNREARFHTGRHKTH